MRLNLFGSVLATSVLLIGSVAAQDPPTQQPRPQTRPQDEARTVTVEGCLMREADVPGRKPNVAERAGIAEDYILTSTKMIKGSAPGQAPRAGEKPTGEKPTGTAGKPSTAMMYEVQGIDDQQLRQHAGRRVQIEGTFENVDRARATPEKRTPADDLVELRGTTIRQVSGECPGTKK
jgi:hypothetical protein